MKRICAGLAGLGLGLMAVTSSAAVFHPETYTLANGMRVVVVTNTLSDAVAQMVWYRVGGIDDPAGRSGSAHYLEHLMFKGTDKIPDGAFSANIAAMGGQDNAFTSADSTAYYVTVSRENLAAAMAMEADRMRGLKIDPDTARTELSVVRNERQERTDNKPQGLFDEKLRAELFGHHPYGRPIIGWPQDLDAMTPQDARAYYDLHYEPQNAVLVLSGNITGPEAAALADATFGRLPRGSEIAKTHLPALAVPANKKVVYSDARVKQPYWTRRMIAPSVLDDPRRSVALEVLAETLAGGEVGILYREMVVTQRKATGLDIGYNGATRGPAVFSIAATPRDPAGTDAMAQSVMKALRRMARTGLPAGEIEKAKKRMQETAIFARDRLMAPAQVLGEALAIGGSLSDVEDWPARIARVTKADVDAALRALVATPYQVDGRLLPQGTP